MKGILVSLMITVAAATSSATSIDPRKVVAHIDVYNLELGTVKATLLDDGTLQVRRTIAAPGAAALPIYKSQKLGDFAFARLLSTAKYISTVEIKKEHRDRVCEFFRMPDSIELTVGNYDQVSGKFLRQSHLVLSELHCGVADLTYPLNSYDQTRAESLRDALEILTLNIL